MKIKGLELQIYFLRGVRCLCEGWWWVPKSSSGSGSGKTYCLSCVTRKRQYILKPQSALNSTSGYLIKLAITQYFQSFLYQKPPLCGSFLFTKCI